MDQVVVETEYLDSNGELHCLGAELHDFGYRQSFFMNHPEFLIVGCKIRLSKGEKDEINALIADLQNRRKEKQPLEYPSAGSTFKRPEGYFAGKLIQDAGLKGYRVGDAQVSEKHAGFVINRGNATSADVRRLISDVQRIVFEKFGVDLECEVRFFGNE
jgi:UDP-N-acetylmuramate dehydrogenase